MSPKLAWILGGVDVTWLLWRREKGLKNRSRNPHQFLEQNPCRLWWGSLSPKAGHNKAGRSDFRNQRFEPDTGKMRKMRTAPRTLQKQGSEETPQSQSAENAENAADWL